ncbi:MurR/RpiR family transcriptional regulator [Shimwellia pseudoproteus]|uniref:transcriptional repressor AlsR n=1 Tax=Shimwellia pseudoproteus TaxID=570012 RepID=UPI0018EBB4DB|nr:transcriptional repressor AlsR [Shimwellia pseudoproteus]MBJ3815879.1 MurR/RpiR family transcriptional regulator [Shimwellia pseudoproteus]
MAYSAQDKIPQGIGLAPWLRMRQEGMTGNESRIVDWLLVPGNLNARPAIKEVAEALGVSEAMIVKVAKLLGFSGFRQLRSAIGAYFVQSEQVLPAELAFDEAPQDVVNKVFNISLRTIMEGQSIVNAEEIRQAARCFWQAKQRDLYGVGGSNAICADIQHKFLRIGIRCHTYGDTHLMAMSAALLQPGDVVLVVTHSGQTSDLIAAVKLAKDNGAQVICITHSHHSPVARLADFIICSPAPDTPLLGRNASARILQLTLLDAFFVSVAQQDTAQATANMQKTAAIVALFPRWQWGN